MVLRTSRTTMRDEPMSSAFVFAQALERKERTRVTSVKLARQAIADRLRIGVGTFENLVRGRVKSVDAAIRDRLQALLCRELEAEIARLSHDLQIARQGGAPPTSAEVAEAESLLAKAQILVGKMR